MANIQIKSARENARGPMSTLREMFRSARTREAEAIIARYANGRLSDAAEREMTEKLLHLGDTFRL